MSPCWVRTVQRKGTQRWTLLLTSTIGATAWRLQPCVSTNLMDFGSYTQVCDVFSRIEILLSSKQGLKSDSCRLPAGHLKAHFVRACYSWPGYDSFPDRLMQTLSARCAGNPKAAKAFNSGSCTSWDAWRGRTASVEIVAARIVAGSAGVSWDQRNQPAHVLKNSYLNALRSKLREGLTCDISGTEPLR